MRRAPRLRGGNSFELPAIPSSVYIKIPNKEVTKIVPWNSVPILLPILMTIGAAVGFVGILFQDTTLASAKTFGAIVFGVILIIGGLFLALYKFNQLYADIYQVLGGPQDKVIRDLVSGAKSDCKGGSTSAAASAPAAPAYEPMSFASEVRSGR